MTPRTRTEEERKLAAQIRTMPPGKKRDFFESMLPDRAKAVERFERYARRAVRELDAWELNWMSERIVNLLGEDLFAVKDEIKAEEAERKRQKRRLKVVKRQ